MLALSINLPWPLWLYLLMSVVTFVVYFADKSRAMGGGWRVSERTLHLLSLLGGWPGAFFAQRAFRHKTRKRDFLLVFYFIVALHLGAWCLYVGFIRV